MSISTELGSTSTFNAAVDVPVIEIDASFYLLIPSRFPTIRLYERIANDEAMSAAFEELEGMTNPRLREKERILGVQGGADTESPALQNWNHAPFTYPNPDGTRFFSSAASALELFDDLQTALAVSVKKREAFLDATSQGPTGLDMRVLSRHVRGRFADCRGWGAGLALEERRKRALPLLEAGLDGLLFQPEERPSATGVAVLSGLTLGRAVQGDHFRFAWNGERINTLYAFRNGLEIDPKTLGSAQSDEALAA